jgi:tRNA1Val (adenine37-N6)-methyltransferase
MSADHFSFKQFTVHQSLCSMKTGTDGVTLGAWVDLKNRTDILDVGTGTGIIALIMAQRNPLALIDAIDIDANACIQAAENVSASPFQAQITVTHASLDKFTVGLNKKYDLVISNPPYFVKSLKSPDTRRSIARHADFLPLENLLPTARALLKPGGHIALILPVERENDLRGIAVSNCMNMARFVYLHPKENRPARRILAELTADHYATCSRQSLAISKSNGGYTADYDALLRDLRREN